MDFFQEILVKVLAKRDMCIVFPKLELSVAELVEMECFLAIREIKAVIENDSLEDFECVEQIVCILEEMGNGGVNRIDFE